jgi:hypothetical protein
MSRKSFQSRNLTILMLFAILISLSRSQLEIPDDSKKSLLINNYNTYNNFTLFLFSISNNRRRGQKSSQV